jgi:hypothetical protein
MFFREEEPHCLSRKGRFVGSGLSVLMASHWPPENSSNEESRTSGLATPSLGCSIFFEPVEY